MKTKLNLTLLIFALASMSSYGQDTLVKKKHVKKHRDELGISILTPLIMLCGADDIAERYTNITYRHFIAPRHALKAFAGTVLSSNNYSVSHLTQIRVSQTFTLTNESFTSTNFLVGLGYEFVLGKRKFKQVFGIDAFYNNKFVNDKSYYETESYVSGTSAPLVHKLDTGAYNRNTNFNKIGFNLSYSIRYEFSRRWLLTTSVILSNKFYRDGQGSLRSTTYAFDANGLISDVSIFYRF